MARKTNRMNKKTNDTNKYKFNLKKIREDFKYILIEIISAWLHLLKGFTFEVKQKIRIGAHVVRQKSAVGIFAVKQKLICTKGLTTIEIILIIVVLVALILIFKDELGALINRIFDNIRSESGDVMSGY